MSRAVEAARARSRAVCSPARTWPGSSPGCDRTISCGTTGQQLPHGPQPAAFDILYWNNEDTARLPAGLHSDFLDLYLTNGLVEGTLEVLGTPVDLGKVSCDSFVVAGHTDHIIPWDGAYRTTQLLGGESQFVLSNGGHIQAILNPPDNPKASYFTSESLPATAAQWRDAATQVTGSWWTLWHEGCGALRHHADATHARRQRAHLPLEPALGRYVHL